MQRSKDPCAEKLLVTWLICLADPYDKRGTGGKATAKGCSVELVLVKTKISRRVVTSGKWKNHRHCALSKIL